MEPRQLLQALMDRDGDNANSLSIKLKGAVKQPQIHKYLKGTAKEPKRSTLLPLAEHYDIPVDAFYDGSVATAAAQRLRLDSAGVITISEPSSPYNRRASDVDVTIPQYDAGGAMGSGLVLEDKQPGLIKGWQVDHEWLRLNVRHHSGVHNLCIVTGFGPSMKGMFNPGDPLLCDRGVTRCDVDAVYFFRVGDHGFIKMLQRIPVGASFIIRAKSKNPDFDPFDITPDMDFQVFGKILTVWKSEQF